MGESFTEFTELASTRDDAAGEAFDKVARVIGLPYPGGAAMDKLAYEGDKTAMKFPSPAIAGDTLDFSFSGPKTAAVNLLHRLEQRGETLDGPLFAAAYTHTVTEAAATKLSEALTRYPDLPLVLAGGVAANSHLRARLATLAASRGVRLTVLPRALCGDNGAMIGAAGYYEFLAGHLAGDDQNASAAD
jgi:N6-L-threonylcarbamoyladenine synthase